MSSVYIYILLQICEAFFETLCIIEWVFITYSKYENRVLHLQASKKYSNKFYVMKTHPVRVYTVT
jgi:hypothetical protein